MPAVYHRPDAERDAWTDAVLVITSTSFNTPGMHEWTDAILVDYLLPVLSRRAGA